MPGANERKVNRCTAGSAVKHNVGHQGGDGGERKKELNHPKNEKGERRKRRGKNRSES